VATAPSSFELFGRVLFDEQANVSLI